MKRTIFLFSVTFILMNAYSQDSGVGIGVVLGEPTGLSGKIWTGEKTAIDAFFELVPVFNLIPATVISLEGGVGIRYFF